MIRIGAAGLTVEPSPREVAALRASFRRRNFVLLPALFEPGILSRALAELDADRFVAREEKAGLSSMEGLKGRSADLFLSFCLHDPAFFRFVRAVTGCPPIRGFGGRTIRLSTGKGNFLNWHSDAWYDPRRLASISVNLGRAPYRGGRLQFRGRVSEEPESEVGALACGDAVLFRAYGDVLHRNTPLQGKTPKISFAGWFYSEKLGDRSIYPPLARKRVSASR